MLTCKANRQQLFTFRKKSFNAREHNFVLWLLWAVNIKLWFEVKTVCENTVIDHIVQYVKWGEGVCWSAVQRQCRVNCYCRMSSVGSRMYNRNNYLFFLVKIYSGLPFPGRDTYQTRDAVSMLGCYWSSIGSTSRVSRDIAVTHYGRDQMVCTNWQNKPEPHVLHVCLIRAPSGSGIWFRGPD